MFKCFNRFPIPPTHAHTKIQFVDLTRFYIASDSELLIDILKGEINFLKSAWQNLLGRPLVTLVIKADHLGRFSIEQMINKKQATIFLFVFNCISFMFLANFTYKLMPLIYLYIIMTVVLISFIIITFFLSF